MRKLSKGDGRHHRVRARGCFKRLHHRGELRVDPELFVEALKQLPPRSQFPRELREDLVLLVGPWERRTGARLAPALGGEVWAGARTQRVGPLGGGTSRRRAGSAGIRRRQSAFGGASCPTARRLKLIWPRSMASTRRRSPALERHDPQAVQAQGAKSYQRLMEGDDQSLATSQMIA